MLNHSAEENARVPPFIIEGTTVVSSGRARFPESAIDDMYMRWWEKNTTGAPFLEDIHFCHFPTEGRPFSPREEIVNQVYRPMAHGMHVLAIHLNWCELYEWEFNGCKTLDR